MFYWVVCLCFFVDFFLLDVNSEALGEGVRTFSDRKINGGKYFQKIRRRRQFINENIVNGEFARFPENNVDTNRRMPNFDQDEDALIFENDDDFNFGRLSTFPRQVPFEEMAMSTQNLQENVASTVQIPGMGTRRPLCEETCPSTTEYNPVCGDDNVTYPNLSKLLCASRCGKGVNLQFRGACLTRARGR